MSDKTFRKTLAGVAFLGLAAGISTAHADSANISYDIVGKADGYISFELRVENISGGTLYGVTVESGNGVAPLLNYGDIQPSGSASQPVTLTWDIDSEPPALAWTVSYTDAQGQAQSEDK